MNFQLRPIDKISDAELAALRGLSSRVYPPEDINNWAGRHIKWALPDWRGFLWDDKGELVSHAGIVVREGNCEGLTVRIGGIGGVLTDPSARRRGHAETVLRCCIEFFRGQAIDFGLLVCEPNLLPYYGRLGWVEFAGTLLVRQESETVAFTFNRVMTLGVCGDPPTVGTVDLCGPPW